MKPPTYTISFRVDGRLLTLLEKEAQGTRLSLHAVARRLVQEALEDTEREVLRGEVQRAREENQAAREEVARLRENLATALEMILLNLTEAGAEEIKAWVSQNLRPGGRPPGR